MLEGPGFTLWHLWITNQFVGPFFPMKIELSGKTHGNTVAYGRTDDVHGMSLKPSDRPSWRQETLGWMSKRFCQRVGRKKYLVVKEQVGRRILSLSNTRNILTCHLLCFSGFLSIEFLATSSDMKQLFNSWSQKKVLCNPHCSYSVTQLAPSDILSHFHCLRLFLCFLNVQADQREPEFWGASRNLGSAIKTASNHLLVSL